MVEGSVIIYGWVLHQSRERRVMMMMMMIVLRGDYVYHYVSVDKVFSFSVTDLVTIERRTVKVHM